MTNKDIASKALVYNGAVIRDRNEMLSLTDMWKAQGSDIARKPSEWLRQEGAQRFIEFLAESRGVSEVGNSHFGLVSISKGGAKRGATFAHWQIGLAYAKYLSPEFHVWCNEVVRERMEGQSSGVIPGDVLEMIRRTDGIARQLSHKVTVIERRLDSRAVGVNPRVAALEYVSVRELLEEAKAVQKGRGSLNRKVGYELRTRALLTGLPAPCRRCPHSGVWLFQRDFASLFMKEVGTTFVADHNARQRGQGNLFAVAPKSGVAQA